MCTYSCTDPHIHTIKYPILILGNDNKPLVCKFSALDLTIISVHSLYKFIMKWQPHAPAAASTSAFLTLVCNGKPHSVCEEHHLGLVHPLHDVPGLMHFRESFLVTKWLMPVSKPHVEHHQHFKIYQSNNSNELEEIMAWEMYSQVSKLMCDPGLHFCFRSHYCEHWWYWVRSEESKVALLVHSFPDFDGCAVACG